MYHCLQMDYWTADDLCSGGGNRNNLTLDTFGPPLRWMLYEVLSYGLHVSTFQGKWGQPHYKESMNWFWWILEAYPFLRLAYDGTPHATQRWCVCLPAKC